MRTKSAPNMSQTKDINWGGIPLLTENALHEKLVDEWASVSAFLKKHSTATQEFYSMQSSDLTLQAGVHPEFCQQVLPK